MLVTSEADMPEAEVYDTYHRLWRIEETFRVIKSELDARPVYLRTPLVNLLAQLIYENQN